MKLPPIIDCLVFGLLTALCLLAVWLAFIGKAFLNAHAVYQGF